MAFGGLDAPTGERRRSEVRRARGRGREVCIVPVVLGRADAPR